MSDVIGIVGAILCCLGMFEWGNNTIENMSMLTLPAIFIGILMIAYSLFGL